MATFGLRPRALLLALLTVPVLAHAQWTADSLRNTLVRDSANHAEVTPLLAPGPAKSTYLSWFEAAPVTNYQLRMQRLDSTGRPMWGARGLLVSDAPQNSALYRYDLQSDHHGDALVAFQDERTGALLPVILKVAADGSLPWGAGIVLHDSLATSGLAPTIGITNTDNVVVAWNASGTGRGWVSARKLSVSGAPLWNTPHRIRDAAKAYTRPSWLAVGADDALLFYVEQTGNFPFTSHAFAQRLTPTGSVTWTAPLNTTTSLPFTFFPTPLADQQDGAYLIYNAGNPGNQTLTTVYAQHLLGTGATAWGADGIELVTGTGTNRYAASANGAVVQQSTDLAVIFTVQDVNQNQGGIALQRLDAAGTRLNGASGLMLVPLSATIHRAQGLRAAANGEAIAVFTNEQVLTQTISALGLTAAGSPAWPSPRLMAATSSGKGNINLRPIFGHQLVIGWADDRLGSTSVTGIYAQMIATNGHLGSNVVTATPTLLAATESATVWPNPGPAARLRLSPTVAPATLTLRDATGHVVRTLVVPTGPVEVSLPVAGLPAGLYLLTVQAEHYQQTLRWVKE